MMTLKDALNQYMENILSAVENHEESLENVFECNRCPFAKQCHTAEEQGNDMRCGAFIQLMLADGSLYKA